MTWTVSVLYLSISYSQIVYTSLCPLPSTRMTKTKYQKKKENISVLIPKNKTISFVIEISSVVTEYYTKYRQSFFSPRGSIFTWNSRTPVPHQALHLHSTTFHAAEDRKGLSVDSYVAKPNHWITR